MGGACGELRGARSQVVLHIGALEQQSLEGYIQE